jgi:hypothetical protein
VKRNRFKPGELVRPRREIKWIVERDRTPTLVVEVDGPVVRTLQGGVIYAWMFDELEAVREER